MKKIPEQSIPRQGASSPDEDEPLTKDKESLDNGETINQDDRDQESYRALRETYARRAFWLSCACLAFWAIIIFGVGLWSGVTGNRVQPLSDKALIAITTGTTLNVFAAFLGVIRGLFPSRETKKSWRQA